MRKILSFLMMTLLSVSLFAATDTLYVWDGNGSTTAAIQKGGTPEAVQASGTNIEIGVKQKGNWCLKINKGFSSGANYMGIALEKGVNAGDVINIGCFRTANNNSYVLGIDFSADKASAATTYQILSKGDPQVLSSDGVPVDSSYVVPEGVKNAKYIRIYRNSGSTGLWVSKFVVKRETEEDPTTKTLYLKLSSDWLYTSKCAAYYFEDGKVAGWSEYMTEVEGETNLLTTTIPLGYSKVIFVRFSTAATAIDWNQGSNQWSKTVDLTIPDGKDLFTLTSGGNGNECNGEWSVFTPSEPAEDVTFYLVNNLENWAAPKAYVFDGSSSEATWPGKAMTKTEDKVNGFDVYSYTFKDNFTKIIFNDGAAENTVQTVDLEWNKAKPYFVPDYKNNEGKYEGTWYATKAEIPAPEPAAKFYITGNAALVGADKAWNAQAIKSTEDSYTITGLKANTEYQLKVIEDGDWDGGKVYGYSNLSEKPEGLSKDNNDNICFKLSEDGDVKVTYFWKEVETDNWQMTFKLEGKFYVAPKKDLYLVPNQWATDGAKIAAWVWNKDKSINVFSAFFAPKAENNDTLVAKVVAEADSVIFVRFSSAQDAPAWMGPNQLNQTRDDSIQWDKAVYTILPGGDYTSNGTWDKYTPEPEAKYYITGDAGIVGSTEKAWQPDALKAMKDTTILNLAAGDYTMRITLKGTWDGGQKDYRDLTEITPGLREYIDEYQNHNICFTLTEAGEVKVIYIAGETPVFKILGNFYVAPEPVELEDGFYLIGKIGGVEGWNEAGLNAAHKFGPNPNNNAEFMLNVTLAAGDEIQVVNVLNSAITAWFPGDEDKNFVVTEAYAGAKTIYFRPDKQGGEGWHYGCIYIAPNTSTGISNTAVEAQVQKVIIDGQIFILRDGKTFNTQGQEVR